MSVIVAIGEAQRVASLAFAGVHVHVAEDAEAIGAAWRALGDDVGVLILTPFSHAALRSELDGAARPLSVVMP